MLFVYDFDFEVGDKEKHKVSFHYEKWTGSITVKVDEQTVSTSRVIFLGDMPLITIPVGKEEKHDVQFDVNSGGFFFIKPKIVVSVDSKIVKRF